MRERREQLVITFPSTSQAIRMENVCNQKNLKGRLIPIPRQITAGCGLAFKTEVEQEGKLRIEMQDSNIIFEKIVRLVLY